MSFYEDLGVRRGATADEIREQYRVLVRLFHPDQFTDPVFKEAAEGQLRRFNAIESVLCDPEQRRVYDENMFVTHINPPIVIQAPPRKRWERRIPWPSLAWGAAAMACAGAIVWVSDHEPTATAVAVTAQAEDWKARANQAQAERDQALRELARWKGQASTSEAPKPAGFAIIPGSTPNHSATQFAGLWFYNSRTATNRKLYTPEFIETQITERDGKVSGRYRSRYQRVNRAISASVNFEFSGQAAGTSAQMHFVRDDGTRGEVHLRLLSEKELELAWTANDHGLPLTNGTAVLIRAQ